MKIKLKTIALLVLMTICQQAICQSTKTTVKVLSFNILHGATTKGDFDLDRIAKVILDTNPDLVALQEVDFKTNRAKKYDLVTELGWRTKMAPLFAQAMPFDGGGYGEGILSKSSFLQTRNVALPFSLGNEPRSAAEITTILSSGDTIFFVGTHLDHLKDESDRISQAREINRAFSTNKFPGILAGDLNATPESKTIKIFEEFWTPSYDKNDPNPTFPSDNPTKKIDYVMFYPKNRWRVVETRVIQDAVASDHCAYLVTLELMGK
ncbi:endonuclease/exonuclease/phosphatase family protein [Reichenbachiella sp. MALMAid0571]|uniref:endonuclease/exonuclease/phosphatase family protein n=1 Tax=Reichenbachiella sp. MALMAid0571 TaxID=3143939 RepID=UPI0032DEB81C